MLFHRCRREGQPVPLRIACYVMAEVCAGLHFAHEQLDAQGNLLGIVHRDVSLQNVLVSYDGDVKLIDFGIAMSAANMARTEVGIVKGKFGYMSPEQVKGEPLEIGGGVGIPPIVFQAEWLAMQTDRRWKPVVMMGSELPFPFEAGQSQIEVSGLSREVTAAMPLMERLGIPSRLASLSGFAGCYRGYVTALAEAWLGSLTAAQRDETAIMCCGPHPMLVAAAALARRYDLPCQASLEENMACAVGGCAGCTVLVELPEGPAMKRVCVDGPVFDAATVVTLQ
jgi:dihydroorotate dehydrogenase electron transfer subunit